MIYLTPEQVLFLHAQLVSETGGSHGVRDLNLLLSALGKPQASFEDLDLYPDIFAKAAALMDSLIRNRPFLDGNKRTGIASAGIFLLEIATWLQEHSRLSGHDDSVSKDDLELTCCDMG